MALITYDILKQQLQQGGGLSVTPSDSGVPSGTAVGGVLTGAVSIDVPQLPKIDFPMDDLTFSTPLKGEKKDLNQLLGLSDGNGGKQNFYAGSQVIINSDRLVLNSRVDYLMLFGQEGVAISSQGNVNIDADDAVTIFGEEGVFIGVPGKGKSLDAGGGNMIPPQKKSDPTLDNDYEPMVLGLKLANLVEDLLILLKNATILTPMGKGYFREDTMYELACLQARLPEILSNYAYVDGLSHDQPDPGPEAPKIVTQPPTTLVGTVTGTFSGATSAADPNAASNTISNPLSDQPDFYDTETLYNDTL